MSQSSQHAFRLNPGADLRQSLEAYLVRHDIQAAVLLTCVGSLSQAALRLASAQAETFLNGPLEIVSATGTLSVNGCHIHFSVADEKGVVTGGHMLPGNLVLTTAEIVMVELQDTSFTRKMDSATGYNELVVAKERGGER